MDSISAAAARALAGKDPKVIAAYLGKKWAANA